MISTNYNPFFLCLDHNRSWTNQTFQSPYFLKKKKKKKQSINGWESELVLY